MPGLWTPSVFAHLCHYDSATRRCWRDFCASLRGSTHAGMLDYSYVIFTRFCQILTKMTLSCFALYSNYILENCFL